MVLLPLELQSPEITFEQHYDFINNYSVTIILIIDLTFLTIKDYGSARHSLGGKERLIPALQESFLHVVLEQGNVIYSVEVKSTKSSTPGNSPYRGGVTAGPWFPNLLLLERHYMGWVLVGREHIKSYLHVL